jgi:palmitoyltransferase ZDHHC1/11
MVPSTVDPDSASYINQSANKSRKQVKISAWKLAKLDSAEAMRAAAKARASSSVLRPIDRKAPSDLSSSASVRTSTSMEFGGPVPRELTRTPVVHSYPHSLASQDDYYESGTGTATSSSFNSPVRGPVPATVTRPLPVPSAPTTQLTNPMFQTMGAPFIRDARGRSSVVWDQEAGRYVSVMATVRPGPTTEATPRLVNPIANANRTGQYGRRSDQNAPTSAVSAPAAGQERLMYTGQSIFFGGPLLAGNTGGSGTVGDTRRVNNEGMAPRERQEVGRVSHTRGEARGERGLAADMFPVFVPGGFQNKPPSNMK